MSDKLDSLKSRREELEREMTDHNRAGRRMQANIALDAWRVVDRHVKREEAVAPKR